MDSLYKHVPKNILPEEYGGDAGPISEIIKNWTAKFLEYRNYFIEDDTFGIDESKRTDKNNKTANDLQSMKGSFRKLEID